MRRPGARGRSVSTRAASGVFNVTNRYTCGAIFQRGMGKKGGVVHRQEILAEIVLSDLTNPPPRTS